MLSPRASALQLARSRVVGSHLVHNGMRGHIAWVPAHDVPLPQRYCAHLINDPDVAWVDRRYWLWVALGYAAPALLGFTLYGNACGAAWGIAWGGCVRVLAGRNVIWAINSGLMLSFVCMTHDSWHWSARCPAALPIASSALTTMLQ
jgi:hypothetical protein